MGQAGIAKINHILNPTGRLTSLQFLWQRPTEGGMSLMIKKNECSDFH